MQNNDFLAKKPIGKLMLKYCLPCTVSLIVAALYNIVDQIFIANADYLGSYGNAANTVIFPLTVIALAIAVMTGDGCCAYVSIKLGNGEKSEAGTAVGNAVILSIIAGVLLTAVYFIFMNPLIIAFGGNVNEQTFAYSEEYFIYIAAGIPFYVFGQAMNPVIRSDGSPNFAMISTLAGAVANIILDPIFIFVTKWGMTGAAVATVIGQIITAVLSIIYLCKTKTIKITKNDFLLKFPTIKRFIPLGICSFLAQISLVAAMAAIQNMTKKYGAMDEIFGLPEYSQIPMAVIGIVMKFFQIVISVSIGLAAGSIPIVGYNIGAGLNSRAKELLTKLLITEFIVGVIGLIAVEFLPRQLISIFGAQNESSYYTEFAVKCFRTYLCLMPIACVNKAAFIFLQAMGKPWTSTLLSVLREVVFGVGFALILPLFFGLNGVLYSMPASDALTFVASVIILVITYKQLSRPDSPATEKNASSENAAAGKNG